MSRIQETVHRARNWSETTIKEEIADTLLTMKIDEELTPPEMWWVSAVKKTKYKIVVILKERWVPHRVEFRK